MKKLFLRCLALCLSTLLVFALSSCEKTLPSAESVMAEFREKVSDLPAGSFFFLSKQEYEKEALRPAFAEALFGNDLSFLADAAVYFGADPEEPLEMGVFVCRTGNDAERMATLCLARISRLRGATPAAETLRECSVRCFGTVVVYTVLPDNTTAMRILGSIL